MRGIDFIILPTMPVYPPRLEDPEVGVDLTILTRSASLAGLPAVSLPIPPRGETDTDGLQIIGRPWKEEILAAMKHLEEPQQ